MSRTNHPHEAGTPLAYRRWRRRNVLAKPDGKARQNLAWTLHEGAREYYDVALHPGRPLDYVTRAYLHTWLALEDTRHLRRRAADRQRFWVRPGALKNFLNRMQVPDPVHPPIPAGLYAQYIMMVMAGLNVVLKPPPPVWRIEQL